MFENHNLYILFWSGNRMNSTLISDRPTRVVDLVGECRVPGRYMPYDDLILGGHGSVSPRENYARFREEARDLLAYSVSAKMKLLRRYFPLEIDGKLSGAKTGHILDFFNEEMRVAVDVFGL